MDADRRWLREWFWCEVLIAELDAWPGYNQQWLAAVNVLRADLERRQANRDSAPPALAYRYAPTAADLLRCSASLSRILDAWRGEEFS